MKNNPTFAELFKKYRLRSEIETLSQFGDLLAQEGLVYENSLFTHWQKGDRVPKDRKVVLALIKLFANREGIKTFDEANMFMASTGLRELTKEEKESLSHISFIEENRIVQEREIDTRMNIPLKQSIMLILASVLNSNYARFIFGVHFLVTVWHVRVWIFKLQNTQEAFVLGLFYGTLGMVSSLYVYHCFKRKNIYTKNFYKVPLYLAMGLLSQWIGLMIWSYYNIVGVKVPYPSFADIGYLGLIPLYTIASLQITGINFDFHKQIIKNKSLLLLLPGFLLLTSYSIFLTTTGFGFERQIKIFLDTVYPLGEIVPIFIISSALIRKEVSNFTKVNYTMLLVAFFLQFITDYAFIFAAQTGTYVNGGFNDYMYAFSYMSMNIVIIGLYRQGHPVFVKKLQDLTISKADKKKKFLFWLPLINVYEK